MLTDVAGATEQVDNGKNGFVIDHNVKALCKAISCLIENKKIRNEFSEYNSGLMFSNSDSDDKLRDILEIHPI